VTVTSLSSIVTRYLEPYCSSCLSSSLRYTSSPHRANRTIPGDTRLVIVVLAAGRGQSVPGKGHKPPYNTPIRNNGTHVLPPPNGGGDHDAMIRVWADYSSYPSPQRLTAYPLTYGRRKPRPFCSKIKTPYSTLTRRPRAIHTVFVQPRRSPDGLSLLPTEWAISGRAVPLYRGERRIRPLGTNRVVSRSMTGVSAFLRRKIASKRCH